MLNKAGKNHRELFCFNADALPLPYIIFKIWIFKLKAEFVPIESPTDCPNIIYGIKNNNAHTKYGIIILINLFLTNKSELSLSFTIYIYPDIIKNNTTWKLYKNLNIIPQCF